MWSSLILLYQLALFAESEQSLDLRFSIARRDISQTLYSNLEYFAQYSGAGYCDNLEEDNAATSDTLLTCTNNVCPDVESAGAYEVVHFNGDDTDQEGFIAIDPTNNFIVVTFRGSDSWQNWLYDILFVFTSCDFGDGCEAEYGFYTCWTSVQDVVVAGVAAAVAAFPSYQLVITGHSLGGAVATIAGAYLRDAGYPCDIYTYGSPRIFNAVGADYVTAQTGAEYRVTHLDDPVPRLPPILFGYRHTSPEYWLSDGSGTTNNYTISEIEICTGDKNVSCNAGESFFDIIAHLHYFETIDACDSSSSKRKRDIDNTTAKYQANAEQKTMLATLDIAYANALIANGTA